MREVWRLAAQSSSFASRAAGRAIQSEHLETPPPIDLSSGSYGQGGFAPPPQRFNPLVQHLAVPMQMRCDPAAQLDLPLIEQAAQPLNRRPLRPGEVILLAQQPVDLSLGDNPGAQALKKQLACCHRFVTNSLHPGGLAEHP